MVEVAVTISPLDLQNVDGWWIAECGIGQLGA